MFGKFLKNVTNTVGQYVTNFRDEIGVEIESRKVADLLATGVAVSAGNEEIAAFRVDVAESEGVTGPLWAYAVESIDDKGMPLYAEYACPMEAARQFVALRAEAGLVGYDQSDEGLFFYDDEIRVIGQLFTSMKLENGKTVAEELRDIESAPYVVNFEPAAGQTRLSREEWRDLATKLKGIAGA